jgi:hypothetical protein
VSRPRSAQFGWHWLGALRTARRNANQETQFALPHRLKELGVPARRRAGLFVVRRSRSPTSGLLRDRRGTAAAVWVSRRACCFCASPYLVPWYAGLGRSRLRLVEDDPPPAHWLTVAITA